MIVLALRLLLLLARVGEPLALLWHLLRFFAAAGARALRDRVGAGRQRVHAARHRIKATAHERLRRATARHAGHPDAPAVDAETGVVNVNRQRHEAMTLNEHIAVWLTDHTGTMQTTCLFAGIGIGSLVGAFTGNAFLAGVLGALSSYFLQLVSLPVIQMGTNISAKHSEARAAADFEVNRRSFKKLMDLEQVNAEQLALIRQQQAAFVQIFAHLGLPAATSAPTSVLATHLRGTPKPAPQAPAE